MPFKRNDWTSSRPGAGVRLSEIVLEGTDSLRTDLFDWKGDPLPPDACVLVHRAWVEYWFRPHDWGESSYCLQPCKGCGQEMLRDPERRAKEADYCDHCRRDLKRHSNREAAKAYRSRSQQSRSPVACHHCGELFTPKRSTAKFCSSRCRVAAHRSQSIDPSSPES